MAAKGRRGSSSGRVACTVVVVLVLAFPPTLLAQSQEETALVLAMDEARQTGWIKTFRAAVKYFNEGDVFAFEAVRTTFGEGAERLREDGIPGAASVMHAYEYLVKLDMPEAVRMGSVPEEWAFSADRVAEVLGTSSPLPEAALDIYECSDPHFCNLAWMRYCQQGRAEVDAQVRRCQIPQCISLLLRAAQIELDCRRLAERKKKWQSQFDDFSDDDNDGFTGTVSQVAKARIQEVLSQVSRCQESQTVPVRCVEPTLYQASFEDYQQRLETFLETNSKMVSEFFPEVQTAVMQELALLRISASERMQACAVPQGRLSLSPDDFLMTNGCSEQSLPAQSFHKIRSEYESAWTRQQEDERRLAAIKMEQQRELERQEREAYARLSAEKRNSKECRVATAVASFCTALGRVEAAKSSMEEMKRLDKRSGTKDPRRKRELTRQLLET